MAIVGGREGYRGMAVFKWACKLRMHRYAPCGWAERMCIWCLRWEENLYSDGAAKWVVKND